MIDIKSTTLKHLKEDAFACHRVSMRIKEEAFEKEINEQVLEDLLTMLEHWTRQAKRELQMYRTF